MSKFAKELRLTQLRNALAAATVGETRPRIIVLVGIPGSGKSTFAQRLFDAGWGHRICQDELGSRQICESTMVQRLLNGHNVVIDRCNFDAEQRKHWIDYAQAGGCSVGVVVFATPFADCISRVKTRVGHPTLCGDDNTERTVQRMANDFTFPKKAEGFQFCRIIRGDQDFERVLREIGHLPAK